MIQKLQETLQKKYAAGQQISILFVCHGNICRSPMAEYVMRYLVTQKARASQFVIDSAATSMEEIGNGTHHGTVSMLRSVGIPVGNHRARRLTTADYADFDVIIGMDSANMRNITSIIGADDCGKCVKLLELAGKNEDIADPWYTDRFDETFAGVMEGCTALLALCTKK